MTTACPPTPPPAAAPAPAATGLPVRVLKTSHQGVLESLALTRDGRTAITGGTDGGVRAIFVGSGKPRNVLESTGRTFVRDLLVVPKLNAHQGDLVYAASGSGVKCYDVRDGSFVASMTGHVGGARSLSKCGRGRRESIASGGEDGAVRLWSMETYACTSELKAAPPAGDGKAAPIQQLACGESVPFCLHAADASPLGRVLTYDARAGGAPMATFEAHAGGCRALACRSADARVLLTAGTHTDPRVLEWDCRKADRPLRTIGTHDDAILSLLSLGGAAVASASKDGTVRVWSCAGDEGGAPPLATLRSGIKSWPTTLQYDTETGLLVAAVGNRVCTWDLLANGVDATVAAPKSIGAEALALAADQARSAKGGTLMTPRTAAHEAEVEKAFGRLEAMKIAGGHRSVTTYTDGTRRAKPKVPAAGGEAKEQDLPSLAKENYMPSWLAEWIPEPPEEEDAAEDGEGSPQAAPEVPKEADSSSDDEAAAEWAESMFSRRRKK